MAQNSQLNKRLKRIRVLLDHLPADSPSKRRCLARLDTRSRAMLDSFSQQQRHSEFGATTAGRRQQSTQSSFNPLPGLARLLSSLEEDIITNSLILKVITARAFLQICVLLNSLVCEVGTAHTLLQIRA